VHKALQITGILGYKNDSKFSLGRHYRDALSGALMISNDRIASKSASIAARVQGQLDRGSGVTGDYNAEKFYAGLVEHRLIIPVGVQGAFGRGAVFEDVLERFNGLVSQLSKTITPSSIPSPGHQPPGVGEGQLPRLVSAPVWRGL